MIGAKRTSAESLLKRLASPGVELDSDGDSGFALYRGRDRRRRAIARISAGEMRRWLAEGLIGPLEGRSGYSATEAGRAAARRESAPADPYFAQHGAIVERATVDPEGDIRRARGFLAQAGLRRLSVLRDSEGRAFFSAGEMRAASLLRQDWEAGLAGQVRGSDWTAAPRSGVARDPGGAAEAAMAKGCDARRRVEDALARLAPPLRRAVERVCLREEGIEALERGEGWPARSGKIALKLGLAQLALGR